MYLPLIPAAASDDDHEPRFAAITAKLIDVSPNLIQNAPHQSAASWTGCGPRQSTLAISQIVERATRQAATPAG
ncbi:hypothetical protein [Rhodopseudomonas sp. BR0M22]|uniref:hypothetical protein n=1 Tax=Rhodopseudomonas sp. BR0M22 TaxID=2269369 RepID=UPI0019672395|nr:hypothetical protein [Rhodopseudomonas sp. BR0M22]NEW93841.1 hypothetical protein [Rhodopseudomonas sp. BR0M22]